MAGERAQSRVNDTLQMWVQEHEQRLRAFQSALEEIASRFDDLGEDAQDRAQSEEYLDLVRKGFAVWDRVSTPSRRKYVQLLLANAAGTSLRDDDVVRLFLDWIDRYHDSHFQIVRAVYQNRGISRLGIWRAIGNEGVVPREDSSDADLFRMLMHDLSTGRIIRQAREVNEYGEFLKKPRGGPRRPASDVMKSSFDDEDAYELSELGQEFVHYVLQDVVSRIAGEPG